VLSSALLLSVAYCVRCLPAKLVRDFVLSCAVSILSPPTVFAAFYKRQTHLTAILHQRAFQGNLSAS